MNSTPFTVSSALDAGWTPGRLRNGATLDRSVWGVRDHDRSADLGDRCRRYLARVGPDIFVSHLTAARLYRVQLPPGLPDAIDLAVRAPRRAPHARGIRGHRLELRDGDLVTLSGLPATSAARTWCDLADDLDLMDLVAAGDHLIRRGQAVTTRAALSSAFAARASRRGRATLREALGLLSARSESRPESHVRVHFLLAQLPVPLINHRRVRADDGWVTRPDFTFPDQRVIVEYQGDYHRLTRAQWRSDMSRRSRLQADGWLVLELNGDHLADPPIMIALVRDALLLRGWTPEA
jgi:hypothetical protein